MGYFKPMMYQKTIHDINYKKLKKQGVKCLIFDLDNTLGLISHKECPKESKQLLKKLKKDFNVIICSNNNNRRLAPYLDDLDIEGVAWSMKPLTRGLRIIRKKYKVKNEEMCIIGDQIVTDILAGKRFKINTVLVDPLGKKDLKITALNRVIENIIVKRYEKKGIFKRGNYYE